MSSPHQWVSSLPWAIQDPTALGDPVIRALGVGDLYPGTLFLIRLSIIT